MNYITSVPGRVEESSVLCCVPYLAEIVIDGGKYILNRKR